MDEASRFPDFAQTHFIIFESLWSGCRIENFEHTFRDFLGTSRLKKFKKQQKTNKTKCIFSRAPWRFGFLDRVLRSNGNGRTAGG